ncbi:phosphatase PAP2 family protein [Nocardioides panacisoli]|uniref:phosphatase PAP2 family protein n=1 Tax=Nocardioides panacisoli TaxID=627624 RepID=UPI001C63A8C1|nr:phosphatase PAP2 family protein [Nocardioides panacisoli]QYJ03239.1 phosphatase PAP2 family protein [Nocardioides panacisoli]
MTGGEERVRRLVVLAAITFAYAVALGLVYVLTVRTDLGRAFEDAALRGAVLTSVAEAADVVLDIVSVGSLFGALAVVALIALVRLARVPGLAAVGIMVGANLSTLVLKEALLSRPDVGLEEYAPVTLNSLPGGHSTAVLSALAAVLFVLPHRLRLPVATAGGALVFLTAVATMSAGWHRAGDSVAAFLVVGGWTALAATVVVAVSEEPTHAPARSSYAARWLGAATAGALALGLVVALTLDAAAAFRDSALGQTVAFLAATLVVLGALAGVLLVTLRVLEMMESAAGASPVPTGSGRR